MFLLPGLAAVVALGILLFVMTTRPASPTAVGPAPARYFDDRAGLLSPAFGAAKNQYLEHLSRTMRIAQINIVILPRSPTGEVEDFSVAATTAWKIGAAGADNGLALFVFRDERKLRLEVGYGLEPVITDAVASRMLAEVIAPAFARGQYEAGIDDFLAVLDKLLESSEAAQHRASQRIDMLPFVMKVLRFAPDFAGKAWKIFIEGDASAKIVMSMFGAVFVSLAVYALATIAAAIPALLMLPARIYSSTALRSFNTPAVRDQFKWSNFVHRPPPVLLEIADELELGAIINALYMVVGLIVGIAFLFVGSGLFMDGLGRFGGGGATVAWPAGATPTP
jgi:uncharacterized membrane protein YgcG